MVELPGDAFTVSHHGRRATWEATDVCVLDSFQFGGPVNVPAKVSLKVRWEATGPRELRGDGSAVPPTDPPAFLGRFAAARSTGTFSGSEVGFSFQGRGDTDRGYAQLGPERNGVFLTWPRPLVPHRAGRAHRRGQGECRLATVRLGQRPPRGLGRRLTTSRATRWAGRRRCP